MSKNYLKSDDIGLKNKNLEFSNVRTDLLDDHLKNISGINF